MNKDIATFVCMIEDPYVFQDEKNTYVSEYPPISTDREGSLEDDELVDGETKVSIHEDDLDVILTIPTKSFKRLLKKLK